ncbi:hypothetical protein V8E55_002865 [Tylopilus felleus]
MSRAALGDLPISSRSWSPSKGRALSPSNRGASSGSKMPPSSSRIRNSALSALVQPPVTTSSASSKRPHSDIGDDSHQERRRKKPKTGEPRDTEEERMIFFPLRIDPKKKLALKVSWQDLARVSEYDAGMTRLEEKLPRLNVIVPLKSVGPSKRSEVFSRELGLLEVENWVLNVSIFELKRRVKFA